MIHRSRAALTETGVGVGSIQIPANFTPILPLSFHSFPRAVFGVLRIIYNLFCRKKWHLGGKGHVLHFSGQFCDTTSAIWNSSFLPISAHWGHIRTLLRHHLLWELSPRQDSSSLWQMVRASAMTVGTVCLRYSGWSQFTILDPNMLLDSVTCQITCQYLFWKHDHNKL